MRALVQRVSEAGVYIEKENYKAEIGKGIVILLGNQNQMMKKMIFYLLQTNAATFEFLKMKMKR